LQVQVETGTTPAASEWLSVGEVRAEILAHPVEGTYTDGRAWGEDARPNGTTVLVEEGVARHGIWFFDTRDRLCFRYDDDAASGGCFRYERRSRNCYDHLFESNATEDPHLPPGTWISNGLLWRKGEPATCDGEPSS
jgi:hypothetical protein